MNSSVVTTTCNVLSVVDLAIIACVFAYLNRRINALEKYNPRIASGAVAKGSVEERVHVLESEIEVLLQRLDAYDQLFLKMMNKMKEQAPIVERVYEAPRIVKETTSPVRKVTIRKRQVSPGVVFARKEPFVTEEEVEEETVIDEDFSNLLGDNSLDTSDDDEQFSFLKD